MFNNIPQPNLHKLSVFRTKQSQITRIQKSVCIIVSGSKQSVLPIKQTVLGRKQSVWDSRTISKQPCFQCVTLKIAN